MWSWAKLPLFDPVASRSLFDTAGDYIFLLDEAHIPLPRRLAICASASLTKSAFYDAKKRLGKGKKQPENALTKVNNPLSSGGTVRKRPATSRYRTFFEESRQKH